MEIFKGGNGGILPVFFITNSLPPEDFDLNRVDLSLPSLRSRSFFRTSAIILDRSKVSDSLTYIGLPLTGTSNPRSIDEMSLRANLFSYTSSL